MASKALAKQIAGQRIEILLHHARHDAVAEPEQSRSYVRLARRIGAHYRVKLSRKEKDSFCGRCNTMLVPGATATVVVASSKGFVAYRCATCGAEKHVFYRKRNASA